MARKGFEQQLDFCVFNSPPVDVLETFREDFNGMYFNRLCPKRVVVC